jgi:glycerophosphoryl diester phosphodiesterase family protein
MPNRTPLDVLRISHTGSVAPSLTAIDFAITEAAEGGAHLVEVDFRATADGVLVVSHDPTVADESGKPVWVHDLTADDCTRLPAAPVSCVDVLRVIADAGLGSTATSRLSTGGRRANSSKRSIPADWPATPCWPRRAPT